MLILGNTLKTFYEEEPRNIVYTIRLDTRRVSEEDRNLIERYYARILTARAKNVKVKVLGNDKTKGVVDVSLEIDGREQGTGTVDVEGQKDHIASLGRLVGMVNLAMSIASLPEEFAGPEIDQYKGILNVISTQCELLTGERPVLPADPKDIISFIRKLAQSLPRAEAYGVERQEQFKLMEEKLRIAA